MSGLLGWGAGGIQQLNQERRQDAQLEMDQISMGLAQAKAQREQATADLEARAAQDMVAAMRGEPGAPGSPNAGEIEDPADALERTAFTLFEGGALEGGMKVLKAATDFRKGEATVRSTDANARARLLEAQLKQTDVISRMVRGVETDEQWHDVIDNELAPMGIFPPEELNRLRQYPAAALYLLEEQALSYNQAAMLDFRAANQEMSAASQRDTAAYRAARLAQIDARNRELARAASVREKNAGRGSVVGAPTGPEMDAAIILIQNEVFGGGKVTPQQQQAIDAGAISLIGAAKLRSQANRGITFDQALQQEITASIAAGDWQDTEVPGKYFGTNTEEKGRFDSSGMANPGRTRENPLAPPVNANNEVDTTKLKKGHWYVGPAGEVGRWNGTVLTE